MHDHEQACYSLARRTKEPGGAPALCEGGEGMGARLRLNGKVGQLEADGPVIQREGRRRRS